MPTNVRTFHLPAAVTATTFTLDDDGTTYVQLSVEDEPGTLAAMTDLAAALTRMVGDLEGDDEQDTADCA